MDISCQNLFDTGDIACTEDDGLTDGVAGDWADDLPVVDAFGEGHVSDDSVGFELTFRF